MLIRNPGTWGFLAHELSYNFSQITSGSRIQEELEPLTIGARSLLFVYYTKHVRVVFLLGLVWAVSHHRWPVGLLMCSQRLGEDSSSRPRQGCIAICNQASEVIPALFSCLKHHMTLSAGKGLYIDFTSLRDIDDRSLVRKTQDRRCFSLLTIIR